MFRVLIIDDTRAVHSFLKLLFGKVAEIQTTSVYNGSEGLKLLQTTNHFDLVLLDWEMPIMNGPETLGQLRDLGISLPIVMMTTKNAPEDIQRMLELGASEFMMKPFTIDILFEKIEYVTNKSFAYAA